MFSRCFLRVFRYFLDSFRLTLVNPGQDNTENVDESEEMVEIAHTTDIDNNNSFVDDAPLSPGICIC